MKQIKRKINNLILLTMFTFAIANCQGAVAGPGGLAGGILDIIKNPGNGTELANSIIALIAANSNNSGNGNGPKYRIGGNLSGLPNGKTVKLSNGSSNDLTLSLNGQFQFNKKQSTNESYNVTVATQPDAVTNCSVQNGSGTVGTADITNVTVTCAPLALIDFLQFGSDSQDLLTRVTTDSAGNIYAAALVSGNLPESASTGTSDILVTKYNKFGIKIWERRYANADGNESAVDLKIGLDGNLVIAGQVNGTSFNGKPVAGGSDIIVLKYSTDGALLLATSLGTSQNEYVYSVAGAADGTVYVAGSTEAAFPGTVNLGNQDAFVVKFNTSGAVVWSKLFSTLLNEWFRFVDVDAAGNVYAVGNSFNNFATPTVVAQAPGGADAFGVKLDGNGNQLVFFQSGLAERDFVTGAARDATGNIYITTALGSPASLGIIKVLPDFGGIVWVKTTTPVINTGSAHQTIDFEGNLIIIGQVSSNFTNGQSFNGTGTYVQKVNPNGDVLWNRFITLSGSSVFGFSVATDATGNVYTGGHFSFTVNGSDTTDLFIKRFNKDGNL